MGVSLKILLWSKYSHKSSDLLKTIEDSKLEFGLDTLCIDNEIIKNRIKEDKNYDITSVPCLLILHSNGVVEKYDGKIIFDWFEIAIKEFTVKTPEPEAEAESESEPEQKPKPKPKLDEFEINKRKYHKIVDPLSDENIPVDSTSITELIEENEAEPDSDRFRNTSSGTILRDQTGYEESPELFNSLKEEPKTALQKKSNDIMSKAKLLARGRD